MNSGSWRNWRAWWMAVATLALGGAAAVAHAQEPQELAARAGNKIWFYRPTDAPRGARLPCVFIGAMGAGLFHGRQLAPDDRAEHSPYVAAGFAVAAFDVSGAWDGRPRTLFRAVQPFLDAQMGVKDATDALEVVLEKFPEVDPARVYIAGHSSAGTLALQVAAASTGFKACLAYAPIVNLERVLDAKRRAELDRIVPTATSRLIEASPHRHVRDITCPVFLFHASDDDRVSRESVAGLERNLAAVLVPVTLATSDRGGHYQSLLTAGIPAGIQWLRQFGP